MGNNHINLGFQPRIPVSKLRDWDSERLARFQLKSSVNRPLSVDTSVWPPIDDPEVIEEYFPGEPGPTNGLKIFSGNPANPAPISNYVQLIAITAAKSDADRLFRLHRIAPPRSIPENFRLVGYDVADDWLTSGLLNASVGMDDKLSLAHRFEKAINSNGLFAKLEDAEQYSKVIARLIPEHAPFSSYGIWLKK